MASQMPRKGYNPIKPQPLPFFSKKMASNGSYLNDKSSETEFSVDPASGGFFHADFKKHDDLKEMLDSNKDNLKLEAMKRIIGMIAKGRDASSLFPAVVKNVVSKNIEVKKLVYVYLERYAEEQQDLALLSISTFQRALKEPNQLIRAGALRVLSTIRVGMIAPIVMLAIRDASADMSPYVRKTAAHAIPKLYSLDPEQKPELITIIQKLLADRTVLVIGSAVMAFTKVCPERVDLIHQVYRKLCTLLVDVDEWGQVIIVNMLTRYARTQFADPNLVLAEDENRPFYDSGSDNSEKVPVGPTLDPDHKLLLRSARPLLQSRNAAVVMSVAQLYYHLGPKTEGALAARALIRLLRSYTEVQSIVLSTIASISYQDKGLFESFLKSFFVRTSDPTRIKLLKLEILTNLAADSNISVILRELQTYISSSDKEFVAATIQAIGRCACSISEITDTCLNGLVSLLSNRDEAVVAESVVVIKRLLQTRAADPAEIVTHMAYLFNNITVSQARAAILWLVGEHSMTVPKIGPDVLRTAAKTFADEEDIVKLQTLNLAVKLHIKNPEQTSLLCQYVFNLARYDLNYDIRDRARFLKQYTQKAIGPITSKADRIFFALKPAPALQSDFRDRTHLQLGSLSHYINTTATGYEPLPPFPDTPPPGDVRNVELSENTHENRNKTGGNAKSYGESFGEDPLWQSGTSTDQSSSEESSSDDYESESSESDNRLDNNKKPSRNSSENEENSEESSSYASSSESSSSSSSSSSSEEDGESRKETTKSKPVTTKTVQPSNLDLLLDLNDALGESMTPVITPSLGGFLSPQIGQYTTTLAIQPVQPQFFPVTEIELLNRINGRGLNITYRFTRNPHLFSQNMVNINLVFRNCNIEDVTDIRIGKKNLSPGMSVHEFAPIVRMGPGSSIPTTLGVDFNDSMQSAVLDIVCSLGTFTVSIKPHIGELLRPVTMDANTFETEQSKLRGMNEHIGAVKRDGGLSGVEDKVLELANVGNCLTATKEMLRFAGQTLASSSLVLVSVCLDGEKLTLVVNCEKIVIGSMLLNELQSALK